jgi:hypothetical protein
MSIDVALYVCGLIAVNVLGPADAKIRAGAWLFLIGSSLSILTLLLSFFGDVRQRVGLAVVSVIALPFWFGFTLY